MKRTALADVNNGSAQESPNVGVESVVGGAENPMRPRVRITVVLLLGFCLAQGLSAPSCAQEAKAQATRKVIHKQEPNIPPLARNLNLHGTVKLEVSVAGSGAAKSVRVLGGNPVLTDAATKAVATWKWEPAGHETNEPVEIVFGAR
jgi:TonB family protein